MRTRTARLHCRITRKIAKHSPASYGIDREVQFENPSDLLVEAARLRREIQEAVLRQLPYGDLPGE